MALMIDEGKEQPQQPGQQAPAAPTWGYHNRNVPGAAPKISTGSQLLSKYRDIITSMIEETEREHEDLDLSLMVIDKAIRTDHRFSSIAIVLRAPKISPHAVAWHLLLLEGTGQKLDPREITIDNQRVNIRLATSDAYDEALYTSIVEAVSELHPSLNIISADANVIPSNITPVDENKEVLANVVRNGIVACFSRMVSFAGVPIEQRCDLTRLDRNERLEYNVSFGNHVVFDAVGAPQRANIIVNLASVRQRPTQNNPRLVNIKPDSVPIGEIAGFLNPIWAPVAPVNTFGFPQTPVPTAEARAKFAAEIVLTSITNNESATLAGIMLSLTGVLPLIQNHNWIGYFLPRVSPFSQRDAGNSVDITSIAALNITANAGNVATNGGFGPEADPAELQDPNMARTYIQTLFRPDCLVSVDCPEAGPQSWYMTLFANAAAGDRASQQAIVDAADELTGGLFSKLFPENAPLFSNITRISLGHYAYRDGIKDIRDIDYTAVANLYKNNPTTISDYSNTFLEQNGYSMERKVADREGIVSVGLNYTAVFTGYAARATWSAEFIRAFSASFFETNVAASFKTPQNEDLSRAGVQAPGFLSTALVGNLNSFRGFGYASRVPSGQMYVFNNPSIRR